MLNNLVLIMLAIIIFLLARASIRAIAASKDPMFVFVTVLVGLFIAGIAYAILSGAWVIQ